MDKPGQKETVRENLVESPPLFLFIWQGGFEIGFAKFAAVAKDINYARYYVLENRRMERESLSYVEVFNTINTAPKFQLSLPCGVCL